MEAIIANSLCQEGIAELMNGSLPSLSHAARCPFQPELLQIECNRRISQIHVLVAFAFADARHIRFDQWLQCSRKLQLKQHAESLAEAQLILASASDSEFQQLQYLRDVWSKCYCFFTFTAFPSPSPFQKISVSDFAIPSQDLSIQSNSASACPFALSISNVDSNSTRSKRIQPDAETVNLSISAHCTAMLDLMWNWNGHISSRLLPETRDSESCSNQLESSQLLVVSDGINHNAQRERVDLIRTRMLHIAQLHPLAGTGAKAALATRYIDRYMLGRRNLAREASQNMLAEAAIKAGNTGESSVSLSAANLMWQSLTSFQLERMNNIQAAVRRFCKPIHVALISAVSPEQLISSIMHTLRKGSIAPTLSESASVSFWVPFWEAIVPLALQLTVRLLEQNDFAESDDDEQPSDATALRDQRISNFLGKLWTCTVEDARSAAEAGDILLLQNLKNVARLMAWIGRVLEEDHYVQPVPFSLFSWLQKVFVPADGSAVTKSALSTIVQIFGMSLSFDDFYTLSEHVRFLSSATPSSFEAKQQWLSWQDYAAFAKVRMKELDPDGELEWREKSSAAASDPNSLASNQRIWEAISHFGSTGLLVHWALSAWNFHRAKFIKEFVPALLRFDFSKHSFSIGGGSLQLRLIEHLVSRTMLTTELADSFKCKAPAVIIEEPRVDHPCIAVPSVLQQRRDIHSASIVKLALQITVCAEWITQPRPYSFELFESLLSTCWQSASSSSEQLAVVDVLMKAWLSTAHQLFQLRSSLSAAELASAILRMFKVIETTFKRASMQTLFGLVLQSQIETWRTSQGLALPCLCTIICSLQRRSSCKLLFFIKARNLMTESVLQLVDGLVDPNECHTLSFSRVFSLCTVSLFSIYEVRDSGVLEPSHKNPLIPVGQLTAALASLMQLPPASEH